jgi:hypothetical protein
MVAEQVTVPVEEAAADGCGADDRRDADLGAVGGGLVQRGDDALAAAGRAGLRPLGIASARGLGALARRSPSCNRLCLLGRWARPGCRG